ncbi:MAG: hypothetical protein IKU84_07140 [Clostridia bacterium]|nr:hypothetical protein [Clostridia bacterium]
MKLTVKIISLILALTMFAACAPTEVKADDEGDYVLASVMSEQVKGEVDVIVNAFLTALKEKDGGKITEYLDANFEVKPEELTAFFTDATNGKAEYKIFDTYYVNGIKDSDISIRIKKTAEDGNYAMLTPGSSEICATMFQSENETVSQMITLLTARIDGKMKIVWIDTSDSAYYGMTAPEIYTIAKQAKDDGKDYLAYVYAQMMLNICQPGNVYFYKETTEITDFVNEMSAWGQEKYPIEVVDDKHKIHLVGLSLEDVGVVPMLFYQTEVDIKSGDLQADAKKVKDEFLKEYPYFKDAFAKITLHATNADPQTATEQADFEKVVLDMK